MRSLLISLAFFVFIFIGFRLDKKCRKDVTAAAWLPLLWLIICSSRSVGQWISLSGPQSAADQYADAAVSGSLADQLVLSLLIICGCFILQKRQEVLRLINTNKLLIGFIVYLGITAFWSELGGASIRKWVRLVGNIVMAAVIVTEPQPLEAIKSLFRRATYFLIPMSVMWIKYFPELGVIYTKGGEKLWTGVAVYKNGLAQLVLVMTFSLGFVAVTAWRERSGIKQTTILYNTIILLMCLWLLKGHGNQHSASAVATLIIGMTIVISSRTAMIRGSFRHICLLAMLAIGFFLILEVAFGVTEFVVTSLGRDMTFTDRVPLWKTLLAWGNEKPLFGYGYESFWTGDRLILIPGFQEAHNGYLELFLDGGMLALLLFAALLIDVGGNIQHSGLKNYDLAVLRLSLFAMLLIANITESCFARQRDLLSFVFFIIAFKDLSRKVEDRTNVVVNAVSPGKPLYEKSRRRIR
jgi:exopolysaccharide production protein ExoQ